MKIKQNDNVIVIAGKDKGTVGVVTRTLADEHKVVVAGVNTKKKHQRAKQSGTHGEIIDIDQPIDVSNVALVDPTTGKPTRVGYIRKDDGTKVRVGTKSGKEI
ncbi:MAG: 50S ribosomal protein L24 [Candidatus Paceibacterota bacterium]